MCLRVSCVLSELFVTFQFFNLSLCLEYSFFGVFPWYYIQRQQGERVWRTVLWIFGNPFLLRGCRWQIDNRFFIFTHLVSSCGRGDNKNQKRTFFGGDRDHRRSNRCFFSLSLFCFSVFSHLAHYRMLFWFTVIGVAQSHTRGSIARGPLIDWFTLNISSFV